MSNGAGDDLMIDISSQLLHYDGSVAYEGENGRPHLPPSPGLHEPRLASALLLVSLS